MFGSVSISRGQIVFSSVFCFFLSDGTWAPQSCEIESVWFSSLINLPASALLMLSVLRVTSDPIGGNGSIDRD